MFMTITDTDTPKQWTSDRIKSLFRNRTQEHFESAIYRMGHGKKSVFWYRKLTSRHFKTIDLAEGEERFREGEFA